MLAYQHVCYGPAPTSCLFLLIHQSMPSGKPNLVTPSLTKLDVEALKRDIPKYHVNMPQASIKYLGTMAGQDWWIDVCSRGLWMASVSAEECKKNRVSSSFCPSPTWSLRIKREGSPANAGGKPMHICAHYNPKIYYHHKSLGLSKQFRLFFN